MATTTTLRKAWWNEDFACRKTDDAKKTIASAEKEFNSIVTREEKSGASVSRKERYVACVVLGSCGDAIGHRDRKWEFMKSGTAIRRELEEMTDGKGVMYLKVTPENFPLSDDSMLNGATAKALIQHATTKDDIVKRVARELVLTRTLDPNRCYGPGTMAMLRSVANDLEKGASLLNVPFDSRGGGCGGKNR